MATLLKITVNDILQIISDWRGESSVNTDTKRIRAVSRAEQDAALRKFWSYFRLPDQTTTGDGLTSTFTIGSTTFPMRPNGLEELFVGGTTEDKRYSIVSFEDFKVITNRNSSAQVCYIYYDAVNDAWKVKLSSTPTSGVTIYYSYFWVPPTRTATGDPVICADPNIVAHNALADIYHSEEELQKEQLERQAAEQLTEEQVGHDNAPAVNQIVQMGAIENTTRNHGIGTY